MSEQPGLFDTPPAVDISQPAITPHRSVHPLEAPRLSRQAEAILKRLQQGPVSNAELARIALKYTGRISDLREAGYRVVCYERDRVSGLAWYRLGDARG